jgi:uncharacterized protein (DUF427 family)
LAERRQNPIFRYGLQWTRKRENVMQAVVDGEVVAKSNDVIDCKGYRYFPRSAVRMDWLQKTEKTADDLKCPHGVQFYDVVVGGARHARAAWSYESPRPEMAQVKDLFGFWQDVKVV